MIPYDDIAGKDALIADAIGINEDDAFAFGPHESFHKDIGPSDKVKGKDGTSDLEIDPEGGERKTWLGGKFSPWCQAQSRQNTRHKFIFDPEKYERHKKVLRFSWILSKVY
ncbi:hypothetical protein Phum_PHUM394620 [Pediculus humanus corporis]|uniref:Uncharacterized protein n=1 Tax=Pediculus humanus subsp. corporis TaxID=121224 RepID=E0VR88_PEDHC|nr:uncharacterized protein Phum_PHUM394620 [Pediculus humanus corporis]EEB15894.1 hypothetical protein Phum_PHUM394620 [Pediculus humanus corporis]